MDKKLLTDEIEKEIDYMAHEIVVPITGNPTTPYEINAVAKYKRDLRQFAEHILQSPLPQPDGGMREKIAEALYKDDWMAFQIEWSKVNPDVQDVYRKRADSILSLVDPEAVRKEERMKIKEQLIKYGILSFRTSKCLDVMESYQLEISEERWRKIWSGTVASLQSGQPVEGEKG